MKLVNALNLIKYVSPDHVCVILDSLTMETAVNLHLVCALVHISNYAKNKLNPRFSIFLVLPINPILYGGVKKTPPPADYRTLILGGCPEWADFS